MSVLKEIGTEVQNILPGGQYTEGERSASVVAEYDVGVKGITVTVDYTDTIIKITGAREYKYPLNEKAVESFEEEVLDKANQCTIYVTGQCLNINRFFTYENKQEAIDTITEILGVIRETVLLFESRCVDFQETNPEIKEEKEYDPEENIKIVDVDNTFHAVSTTTQETEAYEEEHSNFAKTAFADLAADLGASVEEGNLIISNDLNTGCTTKCQLLDDEIMVSVSLPVTQDVGAMYKSYMADNYKELISSYSVEQGMFVVRAYVYPDPYTPEETKDMMRLCSAALDACVKDYQQTLTKKDSTDFASEIQQALIKEAETMEEREKHLAEEEEKLKEAFSKVQKKEDILKQKLKEMEKEKAAYEAEAAAERERIKKYEEEMNAKIQEYEERNTGDILKIQKLANQVAALQNRQSAVGGNDQTEEELFRMKTKVQQLTGQKIALEKKLMEKINAKETRIRQMSDLIKEKEAELQKLEGTLDDQVKHRVAEEVKKTASRIEELEGQVRSIGKILTPEELIEYLKQDPELVVKKLHSTTAKFVAYQDGQLEVRVRFGEMNYVDVSCEASIKDVMLKKLNAKATGIGSIVDPDIKFFTKDKKVTARAYFKPNMSAEDVNLLTEEICAYFKK